MRCGVAVRENNPSGLFKCEMLGYCQIIDITKIVDRKQNFALHVKPSTQAFRINTCINVEEFVIVQITTSRTIGNFPTLRCVCHNRQRNSSQSTEEFVKQLQSPGEIKFPLCFVKYLPNQINLTKDFE